MSLVSLTFRNGYPKNNPHVAIETPFDRAQKRCNGSEGFVEVIKACEFKGADGVYLVAKVTSGCVSSSMQGFVGSKTLRIIDFESKYGSGAKEGMNCGILVDGAELCEFRAGEKIRFANC